MLGNGDWKRVILHAVDGITHATGAGSLTELQDDMGDGACKDLSNALLLPACVVGWGAWEGPPLAPQAVWHMSLGTHETPTCDTSPEYSEW